MRRIIFLILLICFLLVSANVITFSAGREVCTTEFRKLISLIEERLELAPTVAKAKWFSGETVNAPEREAEIIRTVERLARKEGTDVEFTTEFFRVQFKANKYIQKKLLDKWEEQNPNFRTSPDLVKEVRPEFDRITPEMVRPLKLLKGCPHENYQDILTHDVFEDRNSSEIFRDAMDLAVKPLIESADNFE